MAVVIFLQRAVVGFAHVWTRLWFRMKFAKSYFCSANVIWLREILVIVRQVKLGSPTEIGFANLLFRQIVRQVTLTQKEQRLGKIE